MKLAIFALAATALGVGAGVAADFTAGPITIQHPHAMEVAATAKSAGGFMTIVNSGDSDDHLLAVEADFPRVMIHTTEMKDDVAMMMHVDRVTVGAGEAVSFQPGGLHVMFMGITGDAFEAGDQVHATLVFENAGRVPVVFDVVPRMGQDDHQGHMTN